MQPDYPFPQARAFDPHPRGPVPLWLLLAMIGVVLGTAAFVAALAGSATELAGVHYALQKVSIL